MAITLLKPHEVAETLRVDVRQIYRLVKSGELRGVRFGGSVRVDKASLDALLEVGRTDAHS